ncbi:unnamed protein product [Pieris macdunnoughi]|uniref:Uncharacterized protein n=1 Tax=Pieris macdunnoughi TaxID=345717 RepID=A0A821LIS3_9NEOP|nr:unnamed protein product [Pieris macdunnoughi]
MPVTVQCVSTVSGIVHLRGHEFLQHTGPGSPNSTWSNQEVHLSLSRSYSHALTGCDPCTRSLIRVKTAEINAEQIAYAGALNAIQLMCSNRFYAETVLFQSMLTLNQQLRTLFGVTKLNCRGTFLCLSASFSTQLLATEPPTALGSTPTAGFPNKKNPAHALITPNVALSHHSPIMDYQMKWNVFCFIF